VSVIKQEVSDPFENPNAEKRIMTLTVVAYDYSRSWSQLAHLFPHHVAKIFYREYLPAHKAMEREAEWVNRAEIHNASKRQENRSSHIYHF
jgi:hypothetical protein